MDPVILSVFLSTAEVRDLAVHEGLVWAATSGGLEVYDPRGERIAHVTDLPRASLEAVGLHEGQLAVGTAGSGAAVWVPHQGGFETVATGLEHPDGEVVAVLDRAFVTRGGLVVTRDGTTRIAEGVTDAVAWGDALVAGTLTGELVVWEAGVVARWDLPGPAVDLAVVDDEVRVACQVAAATFDGTEVTTLPLPATAAGEAWGTVDGRVIDDEGVLTSVPGALTSVVRLDEGAWALGTSDGLWWLDEEGLRRVTPEGQLCGPFLMGATRWGDRLVAASFDDGACVLDGDRWTRLDALPSAMLNDALALDGTLWLATSSGLVRVDEAVDTLPAVEARTSSHTPGTNHAAVTSLAASGDTLWVGDILGPTAVRGERWRRKRLWLWGLSYQDVAACGEQAWVASEDAGVSWTDGRRWEHHDASTGLPDDWIMAVTCHGSTGFAGTYQDGVWAHDGRGWTELDGLPDPWVLSLAHDGERLWAGTMSGLYVHDGGWSAVGGLPHPSVHDLEVHDDTLLVSTEGGLAVVQL